MMYKYVILNYFKGSLKNRIASCYKQCFNKDKTDTVYFLTFYKNEFCKVVQ